MHAVPSLLADLVRPQALARINGVRRTSSLRGEGCQNTPGRSVPAGVSCRSTLLQHTVTAREITPNTSVGQ